MAFTDAATGGDCPSGSYWLSTNSSSSTACLPCPSGAPSTYVHNAVGIQACFLPDAMTRSTAVQVALLVFWWIAVLPLAVNVARDHYYTWKLNRNLHPVMIRSAYSFFLSGACAFDVIAGLVIREYPTALNATTWTRAWISADAERWSHVVLNWTIVLVVLLVLVTRCFVGHFYVESLLPQLWQRDSSMWARLKRAQTQPLSLFLGATIYLLQTTLLQVTWYAKYHTVAGGLQLVNDKGESVTSTSLDGKFQHTALFILLFVFKSLVLVDLIFVRVIRSVSDRQRVAGQRYQLARVIQHTIVANPRIPPPAAPQPLAYQPPPAIATIPHRPVHTPASSLPTRPNVPQLTAPALFLSDHCVVCMDHAAEVIFVACGHIVVCTECFEQMAAKQNRKKPVSCPSCSAAVDQHLVLKHV